MRTAIAAIFAAAALSGCDFSAGPSTATMLAYQADYMRDRSVWLTREGVQIHSAAAQPVTVALPGWIYAMAPYCSPGFAIGPDGEIVVTSNVIPTLWRIEAGSLAVTTHPLELDVNRDRDVGFAAVAYVPEQAAFVAYSETQRSVWKVDASLKSATRLAAVEFDRSRPAQRLTRQKACVEQARRLAQPVTELAAAQ